MEQYCYLRKSVPVQQRKPANQTFNIQDNRKSGVVQKLAWEATRPLGQRPGHHRTDWNIGFGHLKLNHKHIIFNQIQNGLPQPVGPADNIGFHNNALFSEGHRQYGYTDRNQISRNAGEDATLVNAINANANPGQYNIITNNCQDWVGRVRATANL